MQNLSYLRPESLGEALDLLREYEGKVKIYAGGTDLMVQLRARDEKLATIEYLMDCSAVPELLGIEIRGERISIGAMVTHTEASQSSLFRKEAEFLAAAASTVGSPQIRNNGTLGGNICNGSPAADTLSPLVALDARLIIHNQDGMKECLVKDIYAGAGKVLLGSDELVTRIEFPRLSEFSTAFIKLGRRKALAISRMNVAAALKMESGVIKEARLVPGCVFGTPDRVSEIEEFLCGEQPSRELFEEAGKMTGEEMLARTGVRWSTEYKQPVITALVSRTLMHAAGLKEEDQNA